VHRSYVFYRRFLAGAAILFATALLATPVALAATPAAVDEYAAQAPSAGGGNQGVEGVNANNGSANGAAGTEAQSGGGSLPFTGYPMITAAWIALAFVLAGICIRTAAAGYRRLRRTATQTS
jgi:hypothetical protein